MKSFGRLLRRMRGTTPLSTLATRTRFDEGYLASLEAGRRTADEFTVRHILSRGFELDNEDVSRLVLGIELYDLGLRDNDFRQLTIDLILKAVPARAREEIRRLYHRYAHQA
jgi:hypothetical protein